MEALAQAVCAASGPSTTRTARLTAQRTPSRPTDPPHHPHTRKTHSSCCPPPCTAPAQLDTASTPTSSTPSHCTPASHAIPHLYPIITSTCTTAHQHASHLHTHTSHSCSGSPAHTTSHTSTTRTDPPHGPVRLLSLPFPPSVCQCAADGQPKQLDSLQETLGMLIHLYKLLWTSL